MNPDDAQDLFDRLGSDVPDRRPPTGDLLATGRVRLRRRRRTALAGVVAATVVAIGIGAVVQAVARPSADPAPAGPSPSVGDDVQPGRWPLPSVLGYTEDQARSRLEQLGLTVVDDRSGVTGCGLEHGDAFGTEPGPGAYVEPGDTVELVVAGPMEAECAGDTAPAIDLLRLARAGRAPRFAPTVVVATPAGTVSLTAAQASDPASWQVCHVRPCRNPLDALVASADRVSPDSGLQVMVATGRWQSLCGRSLDQSVPPIVVQFGSSNGPRPGCGLLDVYLDRFGRIEAVELLPYLVTHPATSPVVDVRGMEVGPATEALGMLGFATTVETVGPCDLGAVVHAQDPLDEAPGGSAVTLAVCDAAAPVPAPTPTETAVPDAIEALPCDPSLGFPEPKPGCPDDDPETGFLTATPDGLIFQHFRTFTNDAEGRAYARRHDLDYPFPGDYYDLPDDFPRPIELADDTVCSGSIVVGGRGGLMDHPAECHRLVLAAGDRPLHVAIWVSERRIVQMSELYRS